MEKPDIGRDQHPDIVPGESPDIASKELSKLSETKKGNAGIQLGDSIPESTEDNEIKYPPFLEGLLIICGLFMGVFLVALDQTIIGTAIPRITDEFNTISDVGWYGSAYFLTSTALQPSFGRIYKSFNLKYSFLVAIFFFELGSVLCAVAPSSPVFIVGRAIAGIGVAGIVSGSTVIISFTVPLRNRPLAFGLFGIVWAIAFAVGPIMGGAFTDHVTWRWCFYINLPIGAVTVLVALIFLKSPSKSLGRGNAKMPILERLRLLDLPGAGLLAPAVICLLFAMQWGGQRYAWNSSTIIGLLVGFGLLAIAFISLQRYLGDGATLPPSIMTQRTVASSCAFMFALGGSAYILLYYLPIYFQSVRGTSATSAGIRILPILLSVVIGSGIVGGLITAVGYYTPFLIICTGFFAVGAGLLTTLSIDASTGQWIGYEILAGAGIGAGFQIPLAAVQTVLKHEDIPIGSTSLIFFQNLGGAVFVSVGQAVFQSSLSGVLRERTDNLDPDIIIAAGATELRSVLDRLGLIDELPTVIEAYLRGVQDVFRVSLALSLVAFFASLFLEWRSVKRPQAKTEDGH